MSKTAKLLVISVVCLFLATTFVSAGILDFFTGTQDDLISGSAVSKYSTKEKVTCTFSGGKKVAQSCSSIRGNCRGIGSCTAIVQGPWGARDQWKSSCGGYATTTMDRRNERINFKCSVPVVEKPSPVESKNVKEKVTCIFSGGKKVVQNCSSIRGNCRGIGSCTAIVQGPWGAKDQWKSSCGGYATATMDRRNEKIEFKCAVEEKPSTAASTNTSSANLPSPSPALTKAACEKNGEACPSVMALRKDDSFKVKYPDGKVDNYSIKSIGPSTNNTRRNIAQVYVNPKNTKDYKIIGFGDVLLDDDYFKISVKLVKGQMVRRGFNTYTDWLVTLVVEEKPSTAEQCLVKMPAIIPKNCYTFDQLDLNKDGILNKEDVINDYQDPRIKYCTKSNCDIDGSGKFDAGDMMIFSDLTDYKMVVKNGLFCRTQKYRTSEGLCLDKEGKMFIDSLGGTGQCSTKQELTTSLEEGCNKRCKSEQKPCRMILKSVSTPCE